MTQLSDLLPPDSQTVQAIYAQYKRDGDAEPARRYLGASIIGHPCTRYLWYTFRACVKPEFSGRMYRLFETGDREEPRVCQNLRAIGCDVHELDEQTGEQFAVSFFGGHFSGHLDGKVLGIPEAPKTEHVLECKTHNTKSFRKLQKEGVQKSKPVHYCQLQVYMHGRNLTRALYFGHCKETDELYTERVRYNKEEALALLERAERIITNPMVPERITSRPDDYRCNEYGRPCDAHDICWGCEKALPLPVISCKQCCYATPILEGTGAKWYCEHLWGEDGDPSKPCGRHLCLPGLFPFAESVDYTDGMIVFKNKDDGKQWEHGGFSYTTKELMEKSRSEL